MSVIKSAHHEGKAIVTCPWCGRKWEGKYREYYTCSVHNNGCGGKFQVAAFKIKMLQPYPKQPIKQWKDKVALLSDKETKEGQ